VKFLIIKRKIESESEEIEIDIGSYFEEDSKVL